MQWYVYAIATMILFAATNFLVKVAGEGGMDSIFAANLIWLSAGVMGLVFLAYGLYNGSFQKGLEDNGWKMLILPILAGIFLALGMYFIKRAVTLGDARTQRCNCQFQCDNRGHSGMGVHEREAQ